MQFYYHLDINVQFSINNGKESVEMLNMKIDSFFKEGYGRSSCQFILLTMGISLESCGWFSFTVKLHKFIGFVNTIGFEGWQ